MCVLIGVELRWRNGSDADFLDQEPGKLEIPWSVGYMRREGIIFRKLDGGKVGQDKVTTFRVGVLINNVSWPVESTGGRRCQK